MWCIFSCAFYFLFKEHLYILHLRITLFVLFCINKILRTQMWMASTDARVKNNNQNIRMFSFWITLDHRVVALSLLLWLLAIPFESAIWMLFIVSKHVISIGWSTITNVHIVYIHFMRLFFNFSKPQKWASINCST